MVAHHHALARTGQAGHDAVAAPACWSPAAPSRPTVASALTACCTAGDSRASSGGSWPAAMKAAVAFSRPVTTSPIGALPPPAALAAACCTAGCSTARAWSVTGQLLAASCSVSASSLRSRAAFRSSSRSAAAATSRAALWAAYCAAASALRCCWTLRCVPVVQLLPFFFLKRRSCSRGSEARDGVQTSRHLTASPGAGAADHLGCAPWLPWASRPSCPLTRYTPSLGPVLAS